MQLTRFTDYALRVLLYLTLMYKHERLVTMAEIAQRFQIPPHHLGKIVHQLGQLGYIETVRGRAGGLRLGRAPETIQLGKVVRDTEPTLELVDCLTPPCPIRGSCQLKGVLEEAEALFIDHLDRYTLADLQGRSLAAFRRLVTSSVE